MEGEVAKGKGGKEELGQGLSWSWIERLPPFLTF